MNLAEDIQPVTYLKSHAAHLLEQINETHRPVIITQNGMARAVLQDPQSYENMCNALTMLKLMVQGEADIRTSRHIDQDEFFDQVKKRLESRLASQE